MIPVTAEVRGLDDMSVLLKALPDTTKIKCVKPSVFETAGIMLGYAIANSPYLKEPKKGRTPGALRKNIKRLMKRSNLPWREVAALRVKTARRFTKRKGIVEGGGKMQAGGPDDPWYWFLQEFGFTAGGKTPVPGKWFMSDALRKHFGEHERGFSRAFIPRLEREVLKLYGKRMRKRASMSSLR